MAPGDEDVVTGRSHLTATAYADDRRLAARQAIWRYLDPPADLSRMLAPYAWSGDEAVLDVGCGNGLHIGGLVAAGHRGPIVGLDLSWGMVTVARGWGSVSMLQGDASALPVADASTDVVLAMHMLYHVADSSTAVAELRRVLRPGGVALASTNSATTMAELDGLAAAAVNEVAGIDDAGMPLLPFNLENGAEKLRSAFGEVQRFDTGGTLVIPDAAVLGAYVASMAEVFAGGRPVDPGAVEAAAERLAADVIERDGAFRTASRSGVFVCRL